MRYVKPKYIGLYSTNIYTPKLLEMYVKLLSDYKGDLWLESHVPA